jgi:hypothetical protein
MTFIPRFSLNSIAFWMGSSTGMISKAGFAAVVVGCYAEREGGRERESDGETDMISRCRHVILNSRGHGRGAGWPKRSMLWLQLATISFLGVRGNRHLEITWNRAGPCPLLSSKRSVVCDVRAREFSTHYPMNYMNINKMLAVWISTKQWLLSLLVAQLFLDLLFHCFSLNTCVLTPCQARNALSNLYLQIQSRKAQAIGQDRAIGVDSGLHVLTVGGCQISSR